MANDTAVPLNRIERILAYMIGSVAGLSIVAIIATMVASLTGADMSAGAWPTVALLPLIGLSVAFILIVVFMIVSVVRRRRLARDGG